MKTTHTMENVHAMIIEKLDKLRDSNDIKEQKKLRSEILRLEKHVNDCNDKATNGKKYPERMKGFRDDLPMDQKLLKKLIDDIDVDYTNIEPNVVTEENLLLNGVFITDPTSKDYDKGWTTPKTMKPDRFFK
jgi:hypothetical protein